MTINETHSIDKGEVAYAALQFIETYFTDRNYKLSEGYEDGIHEALWDALSYVELDPA